MGQQSRCELKVLHLLKTAVGATWALRQMRELVRRGVHVHVAMPPGPLQDAYRAAGVTVHTHNFNFTPGRPWLIRPACRTLRRLVDAVAPELIHSHFVGTTVTMRLALGRRHEVPRFFQVPGPLHLEHPLARQLELALAGPSDYWIGSCRWTCEAYRRAGVHARRVFLSYYGIDVDRHPAPDRTWPGHAPEHRAVAPVVGMVAYMYPPKRYLGQRTGLKGHEDLIDALAICRRVRPDLVGVFVGGAWDGATWYERRVVEYGRASDSTRNVFLGTRTDVRDLYAGFDVAVCPSHSENVGAAVESLLAGVPTVATSVGGLPDLVSDGETGWLVPPHDPGALADAILTVLADGARARQLARRGRHRAETLFDIRSTVDDVLKAYETVVTGLPPARSSAAA